jgi:hypothetical protein
VLLVHGFFPLSKTKAAARATERFFADNTDLLRRHGIETSYLTCFSGSEFVIEPSFYWFDELGKFRLDLIEPEYRDKWKTIMADREAREVVLRLREELRDLFFQHGACSVQIAKFYPYQDRPEKSCASFKLQPYRKTQEISAAPLTKCVSLIRPENSLIL